MTKLVYRQQRVMQVTNVRVKAVGQDVLSALWLVQAIVGGQWKVGRAVVVSDARGVRKEEHDVKQQAVKATRDKERMIAKVVHALCTRGRDLLETATGGWLAGSRNSSTCDGCTRMRLWMRFSVFHKND